MLLSGTIIKNIELKPKHKKNLNIAAKILTAFKALWISVGQDAERRCEEDGGGGGEEPHAGLLEPEHIL